MQNHFIFGIHAAQAALSQQKIQKAYLLVGRKDPKLASIETALKALGVNIHYADRKVLDDLVDAANHQGIILQIEATLQHYKEDAIPDILAMRKEQIILILDGVQDPHNLGACLRSADAFGVSMVIAPKDNAVGITPVVRKVACGAAETIPFITVTNLARTIKQLQEQNVWVYGLAGEAPTSIFTASLTGNIALVMGAEGKGIRQLTQKSCDALYHIPMQGSVSSLNVSVATGIALAEATRQRVMS